MFLGAYAVQRQALGLEAVIASIPFGVLVALVLFANNMRDIVQDSRSGIRTLGRCSGPSGRSRVHRPDACAYVYVIGAVAIGAFSPWMLLVFLSAPTAVSLVRTFRKGIPDAADALTAKLDTVFGILFIIALLLERAVHASVLSPRWRSSGRFGCDCRGDCAGLRRVGVHVRPRLGQLLAQDRRGRHRRVRLLAGVQAAGRPVHGARGVGGDRLGGSPVPGVLPRQRRRAVRRARGAHPGGGIYGLGEGRRGSGSSSCCSSSPAPARRSSGAGSFRTLCRSASGRSPVPRGDGDLRGRPRLLREPDADAGRARGGAFWGGLYLWRKDLASLIVSHSVWSAVIFAVLPIV